MIPNLKSYLKTLVKDIELLKQTYTQFKASVSEDQDERVHTILSICEMQLEAGIKFLAR